MKFKNIVSGILAGVMFISLTACNQSPAANNPTKDNKDATEYIQKVKDMDEADFITYIQEYASAAKTVPILYQVVDSKINSISEENYELVRQTEWVSIIYNIAKFQDLIEIYNYGLVFNDDDTFNYEETVAKIGDGVFENIYQGLVDNNLKLIRRNDAPYVTTDVPAFIKRAGNIGEAFKGYLEIVNEIDNHYFIKNGKVSYENLVYCMTFSDKFLKTYTDDQIWETVYQQFYYQMMMYTGLYQVGGFMNEDKSYNVDFEAIVEKDIAEHPDTLFAEAMTSVLEAVKAQDKTNGWNLDILQLIVDEAVEKVTDTYFRDFYKNVYPDRYQQMIESEKLQNEGLTIEDGTAEQ